MTAGLITILLLVLFLPFFVKPIERNLEPFLFLMGFLAAIVSGVLTIDLFLEALEDPIFITLAVLIAGLLFKWLKRPIEGAILKVSQKMNISLFLAIIIVVLGLLSSIITAIIAAIVLVSIVSVLKLDRKTEIRTVILACFSIGLGAVLTPIGEPLATITTNKLNESFSYLSQSIGLEVIIVVIAIGIVSYFVLKPTQSDRGLDGDNDAESYTEILIRSFKIYLFVMGLTLLGAGYEPLVNRYLLDLHPTILYWINMISAVLDNATLAAAEISPAMSYQTIEFLLLGLIISGGMLIPGNIPNIISANKLGITSKEWAKMGVPFGLIVMLLVFIYLLLFG
jgi:predicted cation transporter